MTIDMAKEVKVELDDFENAYVALRGIVDAPAEFKLIALARFAARLREHYVKIGQGVD